MNRRADRVIAVSVITAVALVPTVLVAAVQASQPPPQPVGALPPPQVAAEFEPERPQSPTPTPAQPAAIPQPSAPPPSGTGPPPPPPPKPLVLNAYVRKTDATLVRKEPYGHQRVTENSRLTMESAFGMLLRGTHEVKDALLDTRDPIEMTVKGRTMRAFDGETWATTRLTKQDVAMLKDGNEPRVLTFTVATLPGAQRGKPDAAGLTTFTGKTTFGKLLNFLPAVLLEDVFAAIPAKTPAYVTLKANKDGFPKTLTVRSTAATGNLRLTSIFSGYQLDR